MNPGTGATPINYNTVFSRMVRDFDVKYIVTRKQSDRGEDQRGDSEIGFFLGGFGEEVCGSGELEGIHGVVDVGFGIDPNTGMQSSHQTKRKRKRKRSRSILLLPLKSALLLC